MKRTVSFYSKHTGLFLSRSFSGPAKAVDLNTPEGTVAIDGRFDHLSQRFDLETGKVVDYQPPAPDDDHLWNPDEKRWRLKPEALAARRRRSSARSRIEELERRQARPQRELAIDPGNVTARERLQEIEAEIERLRTDLQ